MGSTILISPNAPSTINSGALLDKELIPRTLIVVPSFGLPLELMTDTPAIFPCNALAAEVATSPFSSFVPTELTAPERWLFFTVP